MRTWTARDNCGNVAVATQYITLIDEEAPVMIGVPDTTCIGDPVLSEVFAIDNCGSSFIIQYTDSFTPNPCGSGNAIRRIYRVSDACGNTSRDTSILLPDQPSPQGMVFTNPTLAALEPDEVLVMDCETLSGQFSASDVRLDDPCLSGGGPVVFTERLVETLDCSIGGVAAVIELRWEYTNICGNVSARTVTVHMMDETSPVFVDFLPEVSIGCNEDLPKINATDNCGEVAVTTIDNIIPGDCEYQYDILRLVTATDPCGNNATRQQMIHVNSIAPIISGVEEGICDDLSIPVVTAYDPCAEEAVAVTMQQDTLTTPCPGGMVIERTWTAIGSCGTVTVMHQRIIME
ncbi:MAG: hypothetical protein IPN33_26205 [Saprospiraceae bacterium]|nr:hypothetical protein [Saprospiraceae bacterium]